MKFTTEEENATQLKNIIGTELPEEDEIIIIEGGIIVVDEEGIIQVDDIGNPIGDSILCGC